MDNDAIVDMTNMARHDKNIHSSSDANDEDSDFEPPTEDVPSEEVSFDEVNIEQVNTDEAFPRAVMNSPLSSYRNSSESDHDVDAKFDEENSTSVFAGQAWYDPACDHSKLEFKEKFWFTSPTQFKEVVQKYAVSVGAGIKWPRSNN
ncbi:hypothetical protein LINPERHAP2_LOCUS10749 [Linum perenne]